MMQSNKRKFSRTCSSGSRDIKEIERRKAYTNGVVSRILTALPEERSYIKEESVCVYATGSTGRSEASEHSDLDLIMLTPSKDDSSGSSSEASNTSPLDEICVKADFIRSIRTCGLSDLDGQGKYFQNFTAQRLISAIGTPGDDETGAFTARLLLLLESRPLIGEGIHRSAIDKILAAYWSDYPNHSDHFIPSFFTNDVLRLWRTFCVNYEARTKGLKDEARFKKRVKNLKLKYNRMITCYSAVLYLLNEHRTNGTVSPDAARSMCMLTPIDRLLKISEGSDSPELKGNIADILQRYNDFLVVCSRTEDELVAYMREPDQFEKERISAYRFGHAIYKALGTIGEDSDFHRLIVV